jgi:hypothetical protein
MKRIAGLAGAAAVVGTLVTVGAPRVATAAEPGPDTLPINVIAIQTNDADDQAEALTKALRVAVRQTQGWSLGAGDYSLEVLTVSLKCPDPPDANCQSRIADQIKSDRYLWGTMKKTKTGTVVGDVHLWVRGKGTSNHPLDYSANLTEPNDDGLKRIAATAIAQLTGGAPKGGVHVRAGNVQGQVFVDGEPLGAIKGEGTFMIPSGPHKVTVKAVGYADAETQVVVKPTGAPSDVSFNMVVAADTTPINGRRIGGIVALGVGGVAAAVGFASMAQVASAQTTIDTLRKTQSMANGFDWCSSPPASISSACSKGHTFQTMQIVMFPVAAVGAGVGIFLIATSGKSAPKPTTGLTWNPQVGPGIGKLDVGYTF